MTFRLRLILTISLLVSLSFGLGGGILITASSASALEKETEAALDSFRTIQSTLYLLNSLGDRTDHRSLSSALEKMEQDRIRLEFFGDLSRLSPELQELAQRTREISSKYEGFQAHICLNYGGRDELTRAMKKMGEAVKNGELDPAAITEDTVSDFLVLNNSFDLSYLDLCKIIFCLVLS